MTTTGGSEVRASRSVSRTSPSPELVSFGVVALFVVVMLSVVLAGRPRIAAGEPRDRPIAHSPLPTTSVDAFPPKATSNDAGLVLIIIGIILVAFVAALAIAGLIVLARSLTGRWQSRPLSRRSGADTDIEAQAAPPGDQPPDAARIRRGIAHAQARITAHPDPGEAIIAAWLGLEETAEDAGAGRGRAETPAEFTLRLLLRRPGIEQPTRRLLAVYEAVRFGGREGTERMRAEAAEALRSIEEGWR